MIKKRNCCLCNCEGGRLFAGGRDGLGAAQVIRLAKKHDRITRREVEELLGISQTTSGRLLKQMTENGQLIKEGRGKNMYYRIH